MSKAVFHRLDHGAALRDLRRYVEEELAPRSEVREVTLIGSLARGNWSARSDADLVVVLDASDEPGRFRASEYAPREPLSVPVDALVYTAEERAGWRDRFRSEVERGILLYRRD